MTDLAAFVQTCESLLDEPDAAQRVADAVQTVIADADALSERIEALRPAPGQAAVVHRGDNLTVLGLEVAAGFVSPAHNHTIWAVVGIYQGNEDNIFYQRVPDGIEETGQAVLGEGEALALPPDAVHRITNSGSGPMRALHVYGGDLFATSRSQWDDDTGEERPFGRSTSSNARSQTPR
jgi:predicted metal-dependent enzyme (double-stranded beta helix superfamily)